MEFHNLQLSDDFMALQLYLLLELKCVLKIAWRTLVFSYIPNKWKLHWFW